MFTRRDWLKVAAASPVALSFPLMLSIAAPSADDLKAVVDKAVKFLTAAQKDDGQLLVQPARRRAGAHRAHRRGARPQRRRGRQRGGREGAQVPRNEGQEGRRRLRPGAVELHDVAGDRGVQGDERGRQVRQGHRGRGQVRPLAAVRRGAHREGPEVRRRGLRQAESPRAGPDLSQHALHGRGAPRRRRVEGRPGDQEGARLHRPQPEPARASSTTSRSRRRPPTTTRAASSTTCLDQDNEKSEKRTAAGGLRSEGGMTYAGLKSFLYAGVSKDDPRVKAAVDVDPQALHRDREPRPGPGRPLLLLPHLRQGDGRARRGPVRGREGRQARLAAGTLRRVEEDARRRTGAGPTRTARSWRACPNSRRPSRSWP